MVNNEDKMIILYYHQEKIIRRMIKMEKDNRIIIEDKENNEFMENNGYRRMIIRTNIMILGDMPGSGKTIIIKHLIMMNEKIEDRENIVEGNREYNIIVEDEIIDIKTNLIIVPVKIRKYWNTVMNMDTKIKNTKTNKELKILSLGNTKKIINLEVEEIKEYDVIILSDNFVKEFMNKEGIEKIRFNRLIVDEITEIKLIEEVERIKYKFCWLITGTPDKIINNNNILIQKIMNCKIRYLRDEFYKLLIIKNEDDEVKESLKIEHPKYIDIIIDSNINYKKMNFDNIERIKIEEVMKDEKICIICYENIIDKIKSEKIIYNECCKSFICYDCLLEMINNNDNNNNDDNNNNKCLGCNMEMILENIKMIENIENKENKEKIIKKIKSKIEIMTEIIERRIRSGNHMVRIMIYVKEKNRMIEIKEELENREIGYEEIRNNNIERMVERYNRGVNKVIIINKNYNGINLEMTSDLIIMDDVLEDDEIQIIGRVQRYGRIKKLNIYKIREEGESKLNRMERYEEENRGYEEYIEEINRMENRYINFELLVR